ncbi:LPXTG cell wall anchor domain-containing protein [Streptococcus suis]|uniref:LPXTG cell wall anchor domain-containing protein n=1 Tax=Streptococcus suis TaxID=1307 RepID=A0A426G7Z1_STRSU|nr:LPXTG cell wall anchor domain-containing protein [Streptococcus suis]RRN51148.1 LPXTG cell wall anchor domain-containing protein [Streptococcus suis]
MKRSSRKKRLAKLSKLGLSLAAVTVLGGLVEPMGLTDFGLTKVYAETYINTSDQLIGVLIWHIAENTDGSSFRLNGDGGYMEVQPGQEIISSAPNYDGYTLSHTTYAPPAWDGGDGILRFVYKQNKIAEQPVEPAGATSSTDTNTVNYTVQLVDENGETLQTIQQSGVEGTEVTFDFPVISGYRVGKTEGFASWTYGKSGTFRLVANKTVKVYYDKAPSIDSLIRPEQRVEYQKVFDEFHTTILKAFEVYKKELGVDNITYEANDLEKIFADSNLSVLHSELVLVQPLFAKPVGLVLTDQDIINAIGWTPEYWDHQIAYHKEIIQKLEKAFANIAASKAIPTTEIPTEQPVEQPVETPTEQPVEQPVEQPAEQPAETPTEQPVEKLVERPTASPTGQSASEKQATKQGDKEPAAPASQSKQSTVKPASTSQSQTKTLPATGEVSSVLHLTGMGLLGLAGLVVKRRSGKSS